VVEGLSAGGLSVDWLLNRLMLFYNLKSEVESIGALLFIDGLITITVDL
jgi:hypothetical protein